MSGLVRWGLGIGVPLLVVGVVCAALDLIPVAVLTVIAGLIAVGVAAYEAIYRALDQVNERRITEKRRQRDGV